MFAIAPWALRAAGGRGLGGHYELVIDRLITAFAAAGEETTLLVVAPVQRAPVVRGGVTVRVVEYLPRETYERLLLGADLVVSDNVIQTSVGKALVAGVPTLVLVDSRGAHGPAYNIFPLELRLPESSAYLRAIAPVELGDLEGIAARVADAWHGGGAARGSDERAYLDALDALPRPLDILRATGISLE
jgi:hypothetical protein